MCSQMLFFQRSQVLWSRRAESRGLGSVCPGGPESAAPKFRGSRGPDSDGPYPSGPGGPESGELKPIGTGGPVSRGPRPEVQESLSQEVANPVVQEDPTQLVMYSVVPEVYSLEPTPKPPTPPAKSVLKESNLDDLIDWCCSNSFVLQPSFVQA